MPLYGNTLLVALGTFASGGIAGAESFEPLPPVFSGGSDLLLRIEAVVYSGRKGCSACIAVCVCLTPGTLRVQGSRVRIRWVIDGWVNSAVHYVVPVPVIVGALVNSLRIEAILRNLRLPAIAKGNVAVLSSKRRYSRWSLWSAWSLCSV